MCRHAHVQRAENRVAQVVLVVSHAVIHFRSRFLARRDATIPLGNRANGINDRLSINICNRLGTCVSWQNSEGGGGGAKYRAKSSLLAHADRMCDCLIVYWQPVSPKNASNERHERMLLNLCALKEIELTVKLTVLCGDNRNSKF